MTEQFGPMGPLMTAPKTEFQYPWKNTDTMLALALSVTLLLLLICSPAIVVGVYRWLW